MALNGGSMGIGIILRAHDAASGVIDTVKRHFDSLDKSVTSGSKQLQKAFSDIGNSARTLITQLAPLGASFGAAFYARKFTQGLSAVGAAMGATTTDMQRLHDVAMEAGIATQFSPKEAVDGLISLATAGQTASQAIRTLKPSLDLAAASLGQLTVDQATEAVVGTLNSYGWAADRAAEVTDKLVQTTMLTNFQAKDFAVGLSRAAEAGVQFRQSLDDILIGMGLLRNRNISADVASTSLRNAIYAVGADARSQEMLVRLGVQIVDPRTRQMRSILDIIQDFGDMTQNLGPLQLNTMVKKMFGEEGLPAFSAILNAGFTSVKDGIETTYKGRDAIAALRSELLRSAGAAQTFTDRYNDNFAGQLTLQMGSISAFFTLIGEVFGELLAPALAFTTRALNQVLSIMVAMPMPLKKVAGAVFLAATAMITLGVGTLLAGRALAVLNKVVAVALGGTAGHAAKAVLALGSAVLPILAIVAALGLLAAAYRTNAGGMATLMDGPGKRIGLYWEGLRQIFDTGALQGSTLEALNMQHHLLVKRLVVGSFKAWHALSQLWDGIKEGFASTVKICGPYFAFLGNCLIRLGEQAALLLSLIVGPSGNALTSLRRVAVAIGDVLAIVAAATAGLLGVFILFVEGGVRFANVLLLAFNAILAGLAEVDEMLQRGSRKFTQWWSTMTTANLMSALQRTSLRCFDAMLLGLAAVQQRTADVARSIREAFQSAWSYVVRLIQKLPAWAVPTSMARPEEPMPLHSKSYAIESNQPILPAQTFHSPPQARQSTKPSWQHSTTDAPLTPAPASQSFAVNVQIDGETVARAVRKANENLAARHYAPLRAY